MNKSGYPNYNFMDPKPMANLEKWVKAFQDLNEGQSFEKLSSDWSDIEKQKFLNWKSFYEGGNHLKYKMAQYYFGQEPGYVLPVQKSLNDLEKDSNSLKEKELQEKTQQEKDSAKRSAIEGVRRKLLSRLNSLEKLLSSTDAHYFAAKELNALVDSILQLKRNIMTLNTVANEQGYKNLIIRQSNILKREGFNKSATILYTFAQGTPATSPMIPASPNDALDTKSEPTGGNVPASSDPINVKDPSPTPEPSPPENKDEVKSKALSKFLENLNPIQKDDLDDLEDNDLLITEAQELPKEPKKPEALPNKVDLDLPKDPSTLALENKPNKKQLEEDLGQPQNNDEETELVIKDDANFDNLIENALSNIRVDDVVKRLQELSKIFKNREIGRQLALIDLMLDGLGLSSFFPSLAEATRSALESNQYCLIRIEEILSKLQGATTNTTKSLMPQTPKAPVDAIKLNLQEQEEKQKQLKKQRKELEEKKLQGNEPQEKENKENITIEEAPQQTLPKAPVKPEPLPAPEVPAAKL